MLLFGILLFFLEWLGINQREKQFLKHAHLYVVFFVFLQIHFRLTQTSFLFHLSAGHNAKPISSCISLIRDYVPPSRRGASLAHTHKTHRPVLTAYSNYCPPCRMACISATSRSHVTHPPCRWWRGKTENHKHTLKHTFQKTELHL